MDKFVIVNTGDLERAALDWAVASIDGEDHWTSDRSVEWWLKARTFRPSTDWLCGGRLIDDYCVATVPLDSVCSMWFATAFFDGLTFDNCYKAEGETHLIAACRAVLHAKLGLTTSIPAELTQ